jgi:hypothetical protein
VRPSTSFLVGLSGLVVLLSSATFAGAADVDLAVVPDRVLLDGPVRSEQLLVSRPTADGRPADVTRAARYEVVPAGVATVDERGTVLPLAEGRAEIVVRHDDGELRVPVEVTGLNDPIPVSFRNEVLPILTKAGCNSGGCHGKAEGQNGFKLSIFGFDPEGDHRAIVMESRGRRIVPAAPRTSPLFLKGSARVPHGGGRKIDPDGSADRLLLRWIAEGTPFSTPTEDERRIVGIEVEPRERVLWARESQQLRVVAIDAAGHRHCVTAESEYESNAEPIAEVDRLGLIEASDVPGEAAILVRYLGHVASSRVTLPQPGIDVRRPPEHEFVDRLVWDKLERLGIEPSDLSSDAEFLRRVHLDTIGTLPTADEARAFLADTSPDKRARLIDALLDRPEYADYWTMKWLDVLRADQSEITPQGTVAMQRWLHAAFRENRPFDAVARELLEARGPTTAEGPAAFYKALDEPGEAARAVSQLLLGVRIECAQCHHHPSERWTQGDYIALAGFFTGVKLKKLPGPDKLEAVTALAGTDLPHPRTGEPVAARALGAEPADFTGVTDRRRVLADRLTARDNPFFARALSNRLWAHYLGRGLIEPIDDIRATNPPTNEPLMQALAEHLVAVDFDLKAFTRTVLNSRVYQLSATTRPSNETDVRNFSHALYRTLPAEVLLDAISTGTGIDEKFNGWPEGYRAVQVWDNRMPSYFFTIFGRPVRASVCECERGDDPSIAQALHLLNAPEIAAKLSHRHGRARQLAESDRTPTEIVDELYLVVLSRFPSDAERTLMLEAFAVSDRRAATEDVLWTLLNSRQFLFNH